MSLLNDNKYAFKYLFLGGNSLVKQSWKHNGYKLDWETKVELLHKALPKILRSYKFLNQIFL